MFHNDEAMSENFLRTFFLKLAPSFNFVKPKGHIAKKTTAHFQLERQKLNCNTRVNSQSQRLCDHYHNEDDRSIKI